MLQQLTGMLESGGEVEAALVDWNCWITWNGCLPVGAGEASEWLRVRRSGRYMGHSGGGELLYHHSELRHDHGVSSQAPGGGPEAGAN